MRLFVLVVLLCAAAPAAAAQPARVVPADDPAYGYIVRLQRRGLLLDLHPTALPYTHGEVAAALAAVDERGLAPAEARWVRLLRGMVRAEAAPPAGALAVGGAAEAALAGATSDRLAVLRPLDRGDPLLAAGDVRLFPNAFLRAHVGRGALVAAAGLQHDVYYDQDPDALDAANRLYVRSAPTYVGARGDLAALYLGRFASHWGVAGAPSLLLSDAPPAFDAVHLRVGRGRLALRSVLGELDSITGDGRFTGTAGADSVASGSERRFLAAHRLDWRPGRRWAFTLMESVVYSGAGSGPSLRYLNPVHPLLFETDNPPKNDENNALLAAAAWAYLRPVTLHAQFLVDDTDLLAESGEPGSYAALASVVWGGAAPAVDLGVEVDAVTARAYNTHQPEGRYVYLQRGLATAWSDYVHAGAWADLYADALLPGLRLTPRVDLLWQGERGFREPYPRGADDVALILDGTPERTVRAALQAHYQTSPRVRAFVDAGVNRTANADHVAGATDVRFVVRFALAVRLAAAGTYGLGL